MSDIFEADELAADAVTTDTPQADVEAIDTRTRDEQGRFAPKPEDAAPPAQEQIQQEPASEGEQQRQVPQGALHAEREKHKGTKAQLEQAQAQLRAIAEMRQQIASRKLEPTAAPEGEDPASETAYLRQRLEQIEGTQIGMQQRQDMARVDEAEHQQLGSVLTQSEAEFRQTKPDYDAAINHVVSARARELALYGLSQMEIGQTLRAEVLDITRSAIQQGRNPAELGYELATLRGYRPEALQQPVQNTAQRTVEAVGQAMAGSRSLGQAAGGGQLRDLNAQSIANMPADEFEAFYSTPEGKRMIDAL